MTRGKVKRIWNTEVARICGRGHGYNLSNSDFNDSPIGKNVPFFKSRNDLIEYIKACFADEIEKKWVEELISKRYDKNRRF